MLTCKQRRQIVVGEYRKVLAGITPNVPDDTEHGRYSGQQIAAAKGIARKRALAIIDAHDDYMQGIRR